MVQTTAALPIWNDRSISLSSKIRLMRILVKSIFLYACESWTLTAELRRRMQAMELRCYRKILHISYKDYLTDEDVRARIHLLTFIERRKLQCYGHVSRLSGLAKTILQGTVENEKMEETGRKIICGAPTTLAVKGYMMIMMIMILFWLLKT